MRRRTARTATPDGRDAHSERRPICLSGLARRCVSYPEIAIFLALGIGYYVGKFTIRGHRPGVGHHATLLAAVLIGQHRDHDHRNRSRRRVPACSCSPSATASDRSSSAASLGDGVPQALFCGGSVHAQPGACPSRSSSSWATTSATRPGFYSGSQTISAAMGLVDRRHQPAGPARRPGQGACSTRCRSPTR